MIQRVVRGPDRRKSPRVVFATRASWVLLGLLAGVVLGWQWSDHQAQVRRATFASVVRDLDDANQQMDRLDGDSARLERRAQIDRLAFEVLQGQVAELMQNELELRREVGIYQEVMSVPHSDITIHQFGAQVVSEGGYNYQLVMAQGMGATEAVSGTVSLRGPGDEVLAESPFSFRHLQFIEGHLELSAHGEPATILLRAELKSGAVVEQVVTWPDGLLVGRQIDVE